MLPSHQTAIFKIIPPVMGPPRGLSNNPIMHTTLFTVVLQAHTILNT